MIKYIQHMNIKAVLCDFDGTLVDSNKQYSRRIIPLIQQIRAKNIHFSLATGRAYYAVKKEIDELNISDYHIFHGGGLVLNVKTNKILWYQPITPQSLKKIVSYFMSKHLIFSLELQNSVQLSMLIRTPAYPDEVKITKIDKSNLPKEVLKILVLSMLNKLTEEEIEKHIKNIQETCKDVEIIKFRRGEFYGLDITSEKATKHTAVLEYAKTLKLNPKTMVAMGDGYNDYPLFTACGYKIAMGNAPKELKDIADKIVKSADEGGTVQALEHILKHLL